MRRIYYESQSSNDRRSHAERAKQVADANTMEDSYRCAHCGRNRKEAAQEYLSVGLISDHVCDSCWEREEQLSTRGAGTSR